MIDLSKQYSLLLNLEYTIYTVLCKLNHLKIRYLVIGPFKSISFLSAIPPTIPPTVKCLYLQNIKYQLKPGSIPNHLTLFAFTNGFSQPFTKEKILSHSKVIRMDYKYFKNYSI
ncbi:hypothetical protein DICPUDRAFT_73921 [Dictyostelium purpureum]|uniref:Uncharacterized protein n=1 Tax=Dictyostelium purpureum TaxID=5786 RepID=F0Z689_DICPU|nr:uncharacterized protein DICPUDRAFT_73921 [Dictyostelium purpureum]EGC40557.1 hypothetical protein DICPUDRAFT_73921 [Dictyostelium purpureum]|eukprot:XP_003282893.1 hypothetical protein DICPUDRAFT_73921 [Dictyostelium purpureum]